ncbi:hypothetical protein E2C01_036230 [Portunus trituberculatus]|uniref:Uncharacterized protein n=1 Tax=Portunus trituberculatus TaxID=210409 RepID=A0A5B7FAN6_PORTR|nr:hypothetical protein [Portunus trituberculatus]
MAFARFPQWIPFDDDLSSVSETPSPLFIPENENEYHRLKLVQQFSLVILDELLLHVFSTTILYLPPVSGNRPPAKKPLPRVRKPILRSDRGQDSNPCAWRLLGFESCPRFECRYWCLVRMMRQMATPLPHSQRHDATSVDHAHNRHTSSLLTHLYVNSRCSVVRGPTMRSLYSFMTSRCGRSWRTSVRASPLRCVGRWRVLSGWQRTTTRQSERRTPKVFIGVSSSEVPVAVHYNLQFTPDIGTEVTAIGLWQHRLLGLSEGNLSRCQEEVTTAGKKRLNNAGKFRLLRPARNILHYHHLHRLLPHSPSLRLPFHVTVS